MTGEDWAIVILAVIANVAFLGGLLYAEAPWKKRPKPTGRARTEYGQGVIPSALTRDMMDNDMGGG